MRETRIGRSPGDPRQGDSDDLLREPATHALRSRPGGKPQARQPVTDFLASGGDGLAIPKDAPRQAGSLLARDIIIAYVKEHRPLTAQVLGAASAGKEPRWTQVGSPRPQR